MEISEHTEYPASSSIHSLQSNQIQAELEKQPHIFIVLLSAMIGIIFALFIAYHLEGMFLSLLCIGTLPLCFAYFLRKVYIHTLVNYQE